MKKINKFYIASLHLEEVFGFHCQVVSLTEELPSAGLPESSLQHLRRQLDAYQAAVTRLDDLLSADTLSPLSKQIIAANKERGRAWRGLNNFAKAMKACPEASVAAAAGRAKAVIDKYGNPTYLPQLQESAILYSLLQELREALAAGDLDSLEKTVGEAFCPACRCRTASPTGSRCRLSPSGRMGELFRYAAWQRAVCQFYSATECYGG